MTSAENYYFGWMGNDALKAEMIVKWINSYQWEGKWEGDEKRNNSTTLKNHVLAITQYNACLTFFLQRRAIDKKKKQ